MKKTLLIATTCSLLLTGCSSTFTEQIGSSQQRDHSNMYLRGVFTWWEADENYKLNAVGNNLYAASVKLVADGQPYDFRFADADWTPGLTCGASQDPDTQQMQLDDKVEGDCIDGQRNFKFVPNETGVYQFFIDLGDQDNPDVYIERMD